MFTVQNNLPNTFIRGVWHTAKIIIKVYKKQTNETDRLTEIESLIYLWTGDARNLKSRYWKELGRGRNEGQNNVKRETER